MQNDKKSPLNQSLWGKIYQVIITWIVYFLFRPKVEWVDKSVKKQLKGKPAVFVFNHTHHFDGAYTGAVLGRHRQKFAALAASLDAMSPLAVLGRGYAVARDEQGKILKSWRETAPGSRVSVTLGEGGFTAVVDKPYTKEEQP